MFSLLIVDDHKHQVDTLAVTLPWEELGITTIYKAYEGQGALAILEAHPVDIVITDIRMPGMSGLELLERVNESNRKIDAILLTGYAEFEYAKKAIELHALEYLIKPVRDQLLIDAVSRIISKRQNELQHSQAFEQANAILHQNLPLLKENLLHDLLQGAKISPKQLIEKLEMYQIPFSCGDEIRFIVIQFDSQFYESYTLSDMHLLEYAVSNIAEELLRSHFSLWTRRAPQENVTLMLKPMHAEGAAWHEEGLLSIATLLLEQVNRYLKGKVAIYVSTPAQFPEEAQACYTSVVSSAMSSSERQGVFILSKQHVISRGVEPLRTLYQSPMLIQLMDSNNLDKLNEKFHAIFQELEQKQTDSRAHLREAYLHVLSCFTFLAHKKGKVLEDIIGIGSVHKEHSVIHSAKQLKAWCSLILEALIEEDSSVDDENHLQLVNKIHAYIEQNLSKDVTLQSISEHVYLHAVYLSKIYKEITGLNLSEYILHARMEEAKRLLEKTSFKIYEITEKVGYQSPQHFIRRFKHYYGVTPDGFRKQ
ncbi:response regulator [Paenibacillus qinlingensis]|uniref:Two-component system response regulator YesN n=1 Tax=Paenibacillus qinlingensis TaxID=1837343 RepID=A0ABU1NT22_9BACL|nr:response regulator [Paenibacillus qinlingensis]MDR6550604.1 two-component system response regulator YesN [Paenibacillus qinlingensis]